MTISLANFSLMNLPFKKKDDGELPSKVKNMSFKGKKVEEPSSSEEDSKDDDDSFVLVACSLSQILKMRRNFKTNIYDLLDSLEVSNLSLLNIMF